jgi:hypothetical protein
LDGDGNVILKKSIILISKEGNSDGITTGPVGDYLAYLMF